VLIALAGYHGTARASQAAELQLRPAFDQRSMSVRYPWRGHLVRGLRLPESDLVRHVDEYIEHERFFGTWQLVQLVTRGAARVSELLPSARLSVGELSAEHGGLIVGHRSHRNGRDIDIGFYLVDETGQPAIAPTFVNMNRHGTGWYAGQQLRFDDARNWALISKLIDDDDARVQYIFVARALQSRLVAHARKIGAPDWLIARARAAMVEPSSGNRHQSHFHVRIYCPSEDRPQCQDKPPYYPWYDGVPPSGEYAAATLGIPLAP
jgi:penicillin-insensitive murein endopeptidase